MVDILIILMRKLTNGIVAMIEVMVLASLVEMIMVKVMLVATALLVALVIAISEIALKLEIAIVIMLSIQRII